MMREDGTWTECQCCHSKDVLPNGYCIECDKLIDSGMPPCQADNYGGGLCKICPRKARCIEQ